MCNEKDQNFGATTTGSITTMRPPTRPRKREFVTDNNMVIVPQPPYSPDLAPCDFILFPKLKMKLKGQRFETVSDIQREKEAVFDSIKENYFHGAFKVWKK
jgi:transposase